MPSASTSWARRSAVQDGTYSTCEGPDPDWYLKASTLRLDSGRDVGTAGKTVIYFKDVPILGTPALSFSLSGARRSGWLPPSIGFGSKGKAEVMVPYYFNIAPNRDLTLFPRIISTAACSWARPAATSAKPARGPYSGETHLEGCQRPHHQDRPLAGRLPAQPDAGAGLDLRLEPARRVRRRIPERLFAHGCHQRRAPAGARGAHRLRPPYWSLTARAQSYQVLQEPAAQTNPALSIPRPYDRLPQINFHTGRYDVKGFDWAVDAEATRFSHPTLGQRQPPAGGGPGQLSVGASRLLRHAQADAARDQVQPGQHRPGPADLSRTLPTVSLDSGMVFERETKLFGSALTQTLEPRLFYVRTPYKNQDEFPNFRHGRNRLQLRPAVHRKPLRRRRPRLGREPADGRAGVALHRVRRRRAPAHGGGPALLFQRTARAPA
jgi:LPS-assembly protein